jgi:isopropylmalate/homocitrate/citramalate synthase
MMLKLMYGVDTGLDFSKFYEISKLVQDILKISLPDNRPIVGDGIFNVESGIVSVWMDRLLGTEDVLEIFPFHWELVGHKYPEIVLGKHSGSTSIENWLKKIGVSVNSEQIQEILDGVKAFAYTKRALLTMDDFKNIVSGVIK